MRDTTDPIAQEIMKMASNVTGVLITRTGGRTAIKTGVLMVQTGVLTGIRIEDLTVIRIEDLTGIKTGVLTGIRKGVLTIIKTEDLTETTRVGLVNVAPEWVSARKVTGDRVVRGVATVTGVTGTNRSTRVVGHKVGLRKN